MSNWRAERDALVSETMAFVEAVRSQRPISTEAIVFPKQLPVGMPEHFQQPVPTVSGTSQVVSDETAEQPRLEQQRFTREREDYALSTLLRVQGGITAPRPDAPKA